MQKKHIKIINAVIMCVLVPLVVYLGAKIFKEKQYAWISLCVAILACVPFFIRFESRDNDVRRLVLIAVMVALSVVGRFVFAPVPGFKPVTAMVAVTAMYFGSEAGFMTGALTAVISNFYFGQGPWTPFQMFAWGIIGFVIGLIAEPLKRSTFLLVLSGIIAGVAFSLLMDVWSTLNADGTFNIMRYFSFVVSSLQFMAIYAVSNVIFLLVLSKPIGKIFERVKVKYGM